MFHGGGAKCMGGKRHGGQKTGGQKAGGQKAWGAKGRGAKDRGGKSPRTILRSPKVYTSITSMQGYESVHE